MTCRQNGIEKLPTRDSDCTHQPLQILHPFQRGNSLVLDIFHRSLWTLQTTKNYSNVQRTVKDESKRMDIFTKVSQSQDHLERELESLFYRT